MDEQLATDNDAAAGHVSQMCPLGDLEGNVILQRHTSGPCTQRCVP